MPTIGPVKNKQSPTIMIAIILAGLIGGYFYYTQILKDQTPLQPLTPITADTLSKFKDIKLNFSILDDIRFKSLKIFGESPVQSGATGRQDIFAPF